MMAKRIALLAAVAVFGFGLTGMVRAQEEPAYTDTFRTDTCRLTHRGKNDFFFLTPGYCLLLQGEDDGESVTVLIKVLRKTKVIDGVRCRVVRETEWVDGELAEVSLNYFAICTKHKGVFYFGEDVDIYEDGEVVSHEGAWRAGVDGAKPGLIMPGYPLVGSRYYQEVAPDVAEDRAENTSVTAEVTVPAGTYKNCLTVTETTPLEPGAESTKVYAPGVGLIQDDEIVLVRAGFNIKYDPDEDGGDDDDDDGE